MALLCGGPQEPYEEEDEDDYKLEPSKGQGDRGQARIPRMDTRVFARLTGLRWVVCEPLKGHHDSKSMVHRIPYADKRAAC